MFSQQITEMIPLVGIRCDARTGKLDFQERPERRKLPEYAFAHDFRVVVQEANEVWKVSDVSHGS